MTAEKKTKGGRNLIFLGVGALAIALCTTSLSLFVYHASGDIYLDRSRPDFLPDEVEATEEDNIEQDYHFSDTGPITAKDLDEYLKELQETVNNIDKLTNPYSESPLSDESLGIPTESSAPTESPAPAE